MTNIRMAGDTSLIFDASLNGIKTMRCPFSSTSHHDKLVNYAALAVLFRLVTRATVPGAAYPSEKNFLHTMAGEKFIVSLKCFYVDSSEAVVLPWFSFFKPFMLASGPWWKFSIQLTPVRLLQIFVSQNKYLWQRLLSSGWIPSGLPLEELYHLQRSQPSYQQLSS